MLFDINWAMLDGISLTYLRQGALLALLFVAAAGDLQRQRISNRLILTGLAIAFLFHLLFPYDLGMGFAVLGLLVGLVMPLPFYLLRGMAAGDVKLLAMAGAFLGPRGAFWAVVLTFLAGGILAIVQVSRGHSWSQLLTNFRHLGWFSGSAVGSAGGSESEISVSIATPGRSVGRMPYGLSIALGGLLVVVLRLGA